MVEPISDKPYISDPAVRERIEKLEETLLQLIARFEQGQTEQPISTDQGPIVEASKGP